VLGTSYVAVYSSARWWRSVDPAVAAAHGVASTAARGGTVILHGHYLSLVAIP
jgi:hypothetical protein